MIVSDLPSPAEASSQAMKTVHGLRAGGKPVSIPDRVEDKLFGIMR